MEEPRRMLWLKPLRRPPQGPNPTADILREHRGIFLILLHRKMQNASLDPTATPTPGWGGQGQVEWWLCTTLDMRGQWESARVLGHTETTTKPVSKSMLVQQQGSADGFWPTIKTKSLDSQPDLAGKSVCSSVQRGLSGGRC